MMDVNIHLFIRLILSNVGFMIQGFELINNMHFLPLLIVSKDFVHTRKYMYFKGSN